MSKPRVVVDTNIAISAALLPGRPRQVLQWVEDNGCLLISLALASEWLEVLRRPKFRRYIHEDEAEEFVRAAMAVAEWVAPVSTVAVCRDPQDNIVLELAQDGQADVVVSGDDDLLTLHPFEGIPIVTPLRFLQLYGGTPASESPAG